MEPAETRKPGSPALAERLTGAAPASSREGRDMLRHLASLSLTKAADGLAGVKLLLSWLMVQLGAASWLVGLLVPLREAGSLLPQLFTASGLHGIRRRKWVWAAAALVQGGCLWLVALSGAMLDGNLAGVAILAAVGLMALARSAASVTHKVVLGATVEKGRRGSVVGMAGSIAAAVTLAFGLALLTGWPDRITLVLVALHLAAGMFVAAALIFARLEEPEDDGPGQPPPLTALLAPLAEDPQLRRFIAARGLLTATALAPPWMVVLAAEAGEGALDMVGAMLIASALAGLVSAAFWGRLSDRASHLVLAGAGLLGALAMLGAIGMAVTGLHWLMPLAVFVLFLAHEGVRISRKTHLLDMAPEDRRGDYAALANTLIGLALLGTGVFGAIASALGEEVTLAVFAVMALAGAATAMALKHTSPDR